MTADAARRRPRVDVQQFAAEQLGSAIFEAVGSPRDEAQVVARDLVAAELLGLSSHGVMRIPDYVAAARSGDARPGAALQVISETVSTLLVDGGRNFGQVVGRHALRLGTAKARATGTACIVVRETHHVGRLGALAEAAADEAMICIAAATVRPRGHFVVPWGGRAGRLGTNPFAYGFPTRETPVVSDFATSVVPEGAVRLALTEGRHVVAGAIVDSEGRPTTDPAAFYGPPRGGLVAFGADVGYKGYALALLAELLGGSLAGSRADDPARSANGLWLCIIDPAAYDVPAEFLARTSGLVDYLKSSPPAAGTERVLVPGERESQRRSSAGGRFSVDAAVWQSIQALATEFGASP